MAFTKILGPGIHTLANFHSHNINSSGIITATRFDGPLGAGVTGDGANFVGVVTCTGLDVNGDGHVSGSLTVTGNVNIGGTITYTDVTNVDAIGIITAQNGINISGNGLNVQAGVSTFAKEVGISSALSVVGVSTFSSRVNFNDDIVITGAGVTIGDSAAYPINFVGRPNSNFTPLTGSLELGQSGSNSWQRLWFNDTVHGPQLNITGVTTFAGQANFDDAITVDGSVGIADSIIHLGNTDTSIRFPSDDTFTVEIAGSESLRIDSAGNMGLGITPSEKLDVNGTIQCLNELRSKTGNDLLLNAGSANRDVKIQVNDVNMMYVKGDTGKVGIGTDGPDYGLHVYGAGDILIEDHANGSAHLRLRSANNGSDVSNWKIKTSSDNKLYIENDTIGGASQVIFDPDANLSIRGEYAAAQDYPNIRPALDFNFAATKKLDSRFRYYRLGGASYIDENGLVKFVSENQPRFDHDPVTREPKGLLIEQTRTNLLRYSHGDGFKSQGAAADYTVGWVQQNSTNSTMTPNAALGPDGTVSALKYTLNATSGRRFDYEEVDLDNSTTYCWSWWMKRLNSGSVWSFQFVGGTGPTSTQIYIDGVEASGQTSTYTPADDNWHRVTWKFTTQANADEQDIGGYDSSGGTGDRWLLWGAQLEAGSFPTSLIPTRGNKATRGYEYLSMGSATDGSSALDRTILNIFDDYEGTIVAEWVTTESEANQNLVSFHKDLGQVERIELRATATNTAKVRFEVVTGSSSVVSDSSISHSGLKTNIKAAVGFKKDDYAYSVNGSAVATDTGGNMPSDINSLMIGRAAWGTSWFDGYVKRIMYYPKRLPNSQLITLTS